MQDYRAVSPTVLADGHHLCETGFATSVTLQLNVSLARGELNVTNHAVDSPVRLVSCVWQPCVVYERERERERGGVGGEGRGGGWES